MNLLNFEWSLSDTQAKWINMYHQVGEEGVLHSISGLCSFRIWLEPHPSAHSCCMQLRRFKFVHGHTDIPADYRNRDEPGWEILAR
jgi:hypothetical protein